MRLYGALIGLSLVWGTSFLFIKILIPYAAPWEIVFLRCLFGALLLYVLIIFTYGKKVFQNLPWFPLTVVGLMNAAIPWTLIALSETKIASSTAAIINATTPVWTSFIGFILFSVFLSKKQWLGILIGFIGILILFNFDIGGLFTGSFVGIGTMVLAPIFYGFSNQFARRYLQGVPVVVIAAGTLTVGYLSTGILTVVVGGFPTQVFTSTSAIASILALGIFGSGIAYLLNYYMITKGSAEFASFVTYLVPVSAMVWGWLILDESLSANLFIGLLVIFGGVYLSGSKARKKKPTRASSEADASNF